MISDVHTFPERVRKETTYFVFAVYLLCSSFYSDPAIPKKNLLKIDILESSSMGLANHSEH